MTQPKIVVSVGGGIASTLVLPLTAVHRYGRENVQLVMCKLPNEDPDVWRLVNAVEQLTGLTVEMIGQGLTPWDIFFDVRFLGNSRIDPCSRLLKREEMRKYMQANHDPANTILAVGITYDEIDRMAAVRKNWTANGWQVDAPLANAPALTREAMMAFCKHVVGFVPRLYLMGMSHNNCGGGCIKAGHAQWARLLWYIPDVYAWWETNEEKFRAEIAPNVAILTDRRNYQKRPMTLREFRLRMQEQWSKLPEGVDPFADLEETPPCVHCEAA